MIASRALSTLIRLDHVIKLNTFTKLQLFNSSRYLVKIPCPESIKYQVRTMSSDVDKEMSDPKRHFDYDQLVAKKDKENVVIIDVREHSEINETGKIPGSIHIPLNELKEALNEMSDERFLDLYKCKKPKIEDEVIFTCRSGRRMAELKKALGELSSEEFKKTYNANKPQKDKEIIFSCKAGGRSLKALKTGLELGYSKAGNYKGGWLDWAEKTGKSK